MTTLTVPRLVSILKKAPAVSLRIVELAPELLDETGKVDVLKAIDRQGELNLAIAEVQRYVRGTRQMRELLSGVKTAPGRDIDDHVEDETEWGDEEDA